MVGRNIVVLVILFQGNLLLVPGMLNVSSLVEQIILGVHDNRCCNHDMPQWLYASRTEQRLVIFRCGMRPSGNFLLVESRVDCLFNKAHVVSMVSYLLFGGAGFSIPTPTRATRSGVCPSSGLLFAYVRYVLRYLQKAILTKGSVGSLEW